MEENLYSIVLFLIEIIFFVLFGIVLSIPYKLLFIIGFIRFVISFSYKHFKVESKLIWDEIKINLKTLLYATIIAIVACYNAYEYLISIIILNIIMFLFSTIINRSLRVILRPLIARKTLIIGTGYNAYRISQIANSNRFAITNVVGFIKYNDDEVYEDILENNLYSFNDIDYIIKKYHIKQVIIAVDRTDKESYDKINRVLFNKVSIIKILPPLGFIMTFNSKINDFDGELLISTSRGKLTNLEKLLKRIIDICIGIVGCLCLIPLTLYVRYKNHSNGDYDPIFFKQERIGFNGDKIYIYKYRSMIPNAEKVLEELMEKDPLIKEEYLTNKKLVNDPRITEVGRMLRKTSLDEFPQFINVLKGDMSFVGPRPYLPREKEDMSYYYDSIIKCKPGITGMWQANGRSDVGFEDRCKLDDYYYKNWTFGLDMVIMWKTIKSVIYGKGAL